MLKKFKLVNTGDLKGLFYQGRTIPFDRIDDALAAQLYGKTHVLERVEAEPTGTTPAVLALAEPTTETSDTGKKKD